VNCPHCVGSAADAMKDTVTLSLFFN